VKRLGYQRSGVERNPVWIEALTSLQLLLKSWSLVRIGSEGSQAAGRFHRRTGGNVKTWAGRRGADGMLGGSTITARVLFER
jgi:hypothetical protein